jgi:hypothetical protein
VEGECLGRPGVFLVGNCLISSLSAHIRQEVPLTNLRQGLKDSTSKNRDKNTTKMVDNLDKRLSTILNYENEVIINLVMVIMRMIRIMVMMIMKIAPL